MGSIIGPNPNKLTSHWVGASVGSKTNNLFFTFHCETFQHSEKLKDCQGHPDKPPPR